MTSPVRPVQRQRPLTAPFRRALRAATAMALVAMIAAAGLAGGTTIVGAQGVDGVDEPAVSGPEPGAPADGTESDDSSPAPTGSATEDDAEVWMVVGALVAVAVALSILTVVYWRRTKPGARRLSFLDEFDEDGDVLVPTRD